MYEKSLLLSLQMIFRTLPNITITMATTNQTTSFQVENRELISYGIFVVRFLAMCGFLLNFIVLMCLVNLKREFPSYGLWFQLVVLASVDIFNGLASFCFSFITNQIFVTNYVACSILIYLFVYAQINTLSTTCCICISRFRAVKQMEKAADTRSAFYHDAPVLSASFFACLYCACPFLIWEVRKRNMSQCSAAFLFGLNEVYLKLFVVVGIFIPWIITNVIYGLCVFVLKRSFARIIPVNQMSRTIETESVSLPDILNPGPSTSSEKMAAANCRNMSNTEEHTKEKVRLAKLSTLKVPEEPDKTRGSNQRHVKTESKVTSPTVDSDGTGTFRCISPTVASYSSYKIRRQAQLNAVKLIGILIMLNTIAMVAPAAVLIRDVILSEADVASFRGATAIGMVFVCLNSTVDAFIYGLYTREIRKYIGNKFDKLRRFLKTRFN